MLITLLGKKLDTGAVSKNVSGINRFRISSYIRTSEYVHRSLVTVAQARNGVFQAIRP